MAVFRDGIKDPRTPKTLASAALLPAAGRYDGDTYLLLDVDELRSWDASTSTWVEPVSLTAAQWIEDEFTALLAQTVFTLSFAPISATTVTVTVNGVQYDDVLDWTILANVATWTNAAFIMGAGDRVIVRYIKG